VARAGAHAVRGAGARRGRQSCDGADARVNTSRLFALAFGLGSALAALGGGLGAELAGDHARLCARQPGLFPDRGRGRRHGQHPRAFRGRTDPRRRRTAFKYAAPEFGAFFIYALTMALLLWRPRGIFGPA